jgi:chemotaxis protein CheC
MKIDNGATDAIRELINIGVGKAAGLLSEMTGQTITLHVPSVRIIRLDKFSADRDSFGNSFQSTVSLGFQGVLSGLSALVFPPQSAISLVMLLTGEKVASEEIDAIRADTLKEVGNIIINAVMGTIANILGKSLVFSLPSYQEIPVSALARSGQKTKNDWVVLASTHFLIEKSDIEGNILLILEIGSLEALLKSIDKLK